MGVVLDIIFPRCCVGCKKTGSYICQKCIGQIKINQIQKNRLGVFKYDGIIRDVIKLIKFELVTDASQQLADLTVNTLKYEFPNLVKFWQTKKMTIVPIPLHWRRENWRGFNQSEILAKIIGKKLKLKVNCDLIIRTKRGKIQSLLSKKEKETNLKDAFKQVLKIPKNIIVFDDVLTTGKTIGEFIKVIPKGTNIFVLTIASAR